MCAKRLKVLLVGTELFGFRHLGLLGNAHLRKKHLAQLPCRVDVQIRLPGLGPHRSLQFRQLAVQLHGIGGQRLRVDPHTCHLDVGQHGDHRRLDLEIEVLQSDLLDQREEHPLEPERDVGILRGVLLHALDVHQVHRQLLGTLADQRLDLDRPVVQVLFGQDVHVVARFGIQQVVEDHRIVEAAPDLNAQLPQHHQVELDVLADLGDAFVLEQRADDLRIFTCGLLPEGHVPRLEGLHGQRKAHDPVVEDVESRRLGIEAELLVTAHRGNHLPQMVGTLHERIFVGRGLRRLELHRLGFSLQVGRRNRRRRHRNHGLTEEVSLSGQRRLLCRG